MLNKLKGVNYWLMEVEYGLEDERQAAIRIGRALFHLRGEKYKKVDHMWREDNSPTSITNFVEYCRWKWDMARQRVDQYILAYEVYKDLNEEKATTVASSQSEASLRPLSRLKNKKDRQRAWEIASKQKEQGEKVTAKDTAQAVEIVKATNEGQLVGAREIAKVIADNTIADNELKEIASKGISQADAYKVVSASWIRTIREWADEEAQIVLANTYIEFLRIKYKGKLEE